MSRLGALSRFWPQLEHIRHSAELGKRTRLHLSHQVGAMHLHRGYRDAYVAGNLFIEATGRDLDHDLTLAGAERIETRPERTQGLITIPTGTIASEANLDRLEEVLIAERLREEFYGTALHRLHSHWDVRVRCDEDDRE